MARSGQLPYSSVCPKTHAWLRLTVARCSWQVRGRKLFVLFPPEDSAHLYPLEADPTQSEVDVLHLDVLQQFPLCARAQAHAAVLSPGEALLVPAGWWCARVLPGLCLSCAFGRLCSFQVMASRTYSFWECRHYAAALEPSVTVMRNFYHRATNALGLVHLVFSAAKTARGPAAA